MNSIVIGSKKMTSWKSFCRVVFVDVTFRAERSDNRKYVCERRLIHGEIRGRTRFVLSGACLLAMAKNVCFHSCHISFGSENALTLSQDCNEMSFGKLCQNF